MRYPGVKRYVRRYFGIKTSCSPPCYTGSSIPGPLLTLPERAALARPLLLHAEAVAPAAAPATRAFLLYGAAGGYDPASGTLELRADQDNLPKRPSFRRIPPLGCAYDLSLFIHSYERYAHQ